MKAREILFIGGGIALIYAISRSASVKKSLQYLQYQFAGVRFKVDNILSPSIIIKLDLYNPNDSAIPVTDFFGNIYSSDGKALAKFNTAAGITVPSKQQTSVEVTAKVSALNVLMNILNGKNISKLTIDGMLKTLAFDLPIKKTIDVKDSLSGVGAHPKNFFQRMLNTAAGRQQYRDFMQARKQKKFKGGFLQYWRTHQVPTPAIAPIALTK